MNAPALKPCIQCGSLECGVLRCRFTMIEHSKVEPKLPMCEYQRGRVCDCGGRNWCLEAA